MDSDIEEHRNDKEVSCSIYNFFICDKIGKKKRGIAQEKRCDLIEEFQALQLRCCKWLKLLQIN